MKKTFFLFASIIMLVQTTFAGIPESTGKFVNDFARVFTQSQTNDLEADLSDYAARTSNQICVVVVDNFGGMDNAQDYAMLLGNKWGIGSKRDNGVMLIVKVKNETAGDVYLAAGYGVEDILTSELCGRIIDEEMIPSLSQEDYFNAVRNAVSAIESNLGNQIVDEKEQAKDKVKESDSSSQDTGLWLILGGFALLGLGFLAYRYISKKNENKPETIAKNAILKVRTYESYEKAIEQAQGVLSEEEIESAKRSLKTDLEEDITDATSIKQFNRLVAFANQIGCVIDSNAILEEKKEEILAEFGRATSLNDVVRTEREAKSFGIPEGDIASAKKQHLVVMRNNALEELSQSGPTEVAQRITAAKQLGCTDEEISRAKTQGFVNMGMKAAGTIAVGVGAVAMMFGKKNEKDDKATSTDQTATRIASTPTTPRHSGGNTKAGGGGQFGNTGAGRKF